MDALLAAPQRGQSRRSSPAIQPLPNANGGAPAVLRRVGAPSLGRGVGRGGGSLFVPEPPTLRAAAVGGRDGLHRRQDVLRAAFGAAVTDGLGLVHTVEEDQPPCQVHGDLDRRSSLQGKRWSAAFSAFAVARARTADSAGAAVVQAGWRGSPPSSCRKRCSDRSWPRARPAAVLQERLRQSLDRMDRRAHVPCRPLQDLVSREARLGDSSMPRTIRFGR